MWPFTKKQKKTRRGILRHVVTAPARSHLVQRKKRIRDAFFFDHYDRLLRFSTKFISKQLLLACVSITIFGVALGILFFSKFFLVKDVALVRDTPLIPVEKYREFLAENVGQNILFISTHNLEEELKQKYPELSQVRVRKLFPETIQVQVSTQHLFSRLKVVGGTDEFFLTSNGMVLKNETGDGIENISQDLPLIELPLYEELKEEDRKKVVDILGLKVGARFLTGEQVAMISYILEMFKKNFHYTVEKSLYRPLEKELWLVLKSGTVVFLSLDPLDRASVETQLYKLKQDEGELALERGDLAYVDVRVVDKVLFCRKGKQCEQFVRGIAGSDKIKQKPAKDS